MFKHNLSFLDIGIRYIVMMVFMILAGVTGNVILFTVLGVAAFLTAILGWCPMYDMIGFRTRNEQ